MLKKLLIAIGLIEDKKKAPTIAKFIEELDKLINIISTAEENIKTIHKHFGEYND